MPFADRVEVTEIREVFEGDTYAPKIDREPLSVGEWQQSSSGLHYRFVSY
ncbi:dihydrofolate reductase [Lentzea kentuckyensis]|nr:dihydrofolate reductase [Lentzea kentuckyensis]